MQLSIFDGHPEFLAAVLFGLTLLVVAAMLGHSLARFMRQPMVFGTIVLGIAAGNIGHWLELPFFTLTMYQSDAWNLLIDAWQQGIGITEAARQTIALGGGDPQVTTLLSSLLSGPQASLLIVMTISGWLFAILGMVLLLFLVGLDQSLAGLRTFGGRSLALGVLGVCLPLVTGTGVTIWLTDTGLGGSLFVGLALAATSIAVSAGVFREAQTSRSAEAGMVLGAAVADDILTLLLLGLIVGLVLDAALGLENLLPMLSAAVFLITFWLVGERLAGYGARLFDYLDHDQVKIFYPLALALLVAGAAQSIHLGAVTGAFIAGLILNDRAFPASHASVPEAIGIRATMTPLADLFVPLYFVFIGAQVHLSQLANPEVLGLASALFVVAMVTKISAAFLVLPRSNWWVTGLGMAPRGEVLLVVAALGKALGLLDQALFAVLVLVMLGTMLTVPPLLARALR